MSVQTTAQTIKNLAIRPFLLLVFITNLLELNGLTVAWYVMSDTAQVATRQVNFEIIVVDHRARQETVLLRSDVFSGNSDESCRLLRLFDHFTSESVNVSKPSIRKEQVL